MGGVQRVDKVGGHGVLLFPGVGRVAGVPGHPHVESLELSAHLQSSISEVSCVCKTFNSACYCMSYGLLE